jgi:hypothetical protein
MKNWLFRKMFSAIFSVILLLICSAGYAENIDPNDDGSQYAWGENIGWLNVEPPGDSEPGVQVEDSKLTGYMWGENVGWISLSHSYGGVENDGMGDLTGYAWGENIGWISFSCQNTASCGIADYGVTINSATGEFTGYAWGENIGWINFAPNGVGVKTSWRGDTDGDGIPDDQDACPDEDATGFDADGDGCIDSVSGLAALVQTLVDQKVIDQQMQNSLLSKIKNASQSADKENICAAVHQLEALINHVNAQRGKKISDEAADQIIAYAQSVINWYLDQLPEGETCQ